MATEETIIQIAPAPYVTLKVAESITGLTVKAMTRKIEEGKWVEGREYRYSPDGGVFMSLDGYRRWIESGNGSKRAFKIPKVSPGRTG